MRIFEIVCRTRACQSKIPFTSTVFVKILCLYMHGRHNVVKSFAVRKNGIITLFLESYLLYFTDKYCLLFLYVLRYPELSYRSSNFPSVIATTPITFLLFLFSLLSVYITSESKKTFPNNNLLSPVPILFHIFSCILELLHNKHLLLVNQA